MIQHLSAEQISQWMTGERTPQLEEHVAECAPCRVELQELEASLGQFRTAMRRWSSAAAPPAWQAPEPRSRWMAWRRLMLAGATAAILAAAPLYWSAREHQLHRAAEAAQAAADAQLLEQVDASISQAVPEPMEPLVSLVEWNSGSDTKVEKP